jgi:transcriptional regulator with XRE-family HTH domain
LALQYDHISKQHIGGIAMTKMFPVIDMAATGENIARLRKDRGLTVRDLQDWFGFEEPQAIYKWQKGKSLPTVDNLYALGMLLDVPMEEILVPCKPELNIVKNGQQEIPAALRFCPALLNTVKLQVHVTIFCCPFLLAV